MTTTYVGRIAHLINSNDRIYGYIACYMSHGAHCAKRFNTESEAIDFLKSIDQYNA